MTVPEPSILRYVRWLREARSLGRKSRIEVWDLEFDYSPLLFHSRKIDEQMQAAAAQRFGKFTGAI